MEKHSVNGKTVQFMYNQMKVVQRTNEVHIHEVHILH